MAGIELLTQIFDTIKFILVWFWWAILLVIIIGFKLRWKNWPLEVVIIEKRGNNLIETNDRAGRVIDPYTGLHLYKLQKAKDSIMIPNYDHILHKVAQHTTIFERFTNLLRGNVGTLFLFRYGSKQYKPLKIKSNKFETKYEEIKDKDGNPVYVKVYKVLDPRKDLSLIDFEVVDWDNMNQMVQEWKATQERRTKSKEFWRQIAIPAIMIGATAIICIVMIKFGYDYAVQLKQSTPTQPQAQTPNIPVISDVIPG